MVFASKEWVRGELKWRVMAENDISKQLRSLDNKFDALLEKLNLDIDFQSQYVFVKKKGRK